MRLLTVSLCLVALIGCGDVEREPIAHTTSQELRPTDTSSGLMWRFGSADTVESFGVADGGYRVHFTRAGTNAVPAADTNSNGVPDFVDVVDATYEAVGALYHGPLSFRRPAGDSAIANNGGDGRFDIYLLDFARAADGAFRVDQCPPAPGHCIGYVVQENDYAGYGYPNTTIANRILASHEYFHAVQSAYDDDVNIVFSEGTAVWATERFDPTTTDFEAFVHGYLDRPDRSLDSPPPGPVPSFAYGSAIFFKFLTERHDDALIRKVLERLENGAGDPLEPMDQANPTWLVQLDAVLKRDYASSFAIEFTEFTKWNVFTAGAADPLESYAEGSRYPVVLTTPITLPHKVDGLRVFYASSQYFTAPAAGRTRVTAALTDPPLSLGDDREAVALWLIARKNGRNTEAVQIVDGGESVEVSGGSVIVAIANTRRGAIGTSLAQRPGVCVGTSDEVASCVAALNGVDAGVDGGVDAGTEPVDAGMGEPPPPVGCHCGMGVSPLWFFAVLVGRRRKVGDRVT